MSAAQYSLSRVGAADPQEQVRVTIKLRRKTQEGFPTLQEFIDGKRARITRHELEEKYGGSASDAKVVQKWANERGLSTLQLHLGKRRLELAGTAAAVQSAFNVELSNYVHWPSGTSFRRPEAEVRIPESLSKIVVGIFGIDESPVVRRHTMTAARGRSLASGDDPKQRNPMAFYPPEVRSLYKFPTTTGKGQKVAILEF